MKRQLPLDMAGVRRRQLETQQAQQTKRARQEEEDGGAGEQPGTGLAVQRNSQQDFRDSNASSVFKVVWATTIKMEDFFAPFL